MVSSVGYSQTVIVNYSEKRIISKEKLEAMPEFARKQALESYAYILQYSNGVSLYKNSLATKNVETLVKGAAEGETYDKAVNVRESSYRVTNNSVEKSYFKDIQGNELLFKFNNFNKDFFGKDNLLQWDWQITNETKEVSGFVCKKAISEAFGYYFTAWFTEDIAINAGPEKFDSLPGLILYVGTAYYEYVATNVSIEKNAIQIVRPDVPKETVTMAQVENYVKEGRGKLQSGTTTKVEGTTTTTRTTTVIR